MKVVAKSLAFVVATAFAAAPALAQETVRWGVPMAFGSNLTALGDTMPWVSEQLKKVSGGTINLQVFEPGKLVPALGIFDAVSSGKVEAGFSWMGYETGKVPASALFGAVPFGMESPQYAAWMYFGGGDALLKEAFKPHNVTRFLRHDQPRGGGLVQERDQDARGPQGPEVPRRRAGRQDLPEGRLLGDVAARR